MPAATPKLRIAVMTDTTQFSGGRVWLFQYANYLRERGHDVQVYALRDDGDLKEMAQAKVLERFDRQSLPEVDLFLLSVPRLIDDVMASRRGRVVLFCQGTQVIDLEQRIAQATENVPAIVNLLRPPWQRVARWKRRVKKLDRLYGMPESMITVSPHLQEFLQNRYHKSVPLCKYGIRDEIFYPNTDASHLERTFTAESPCRIISIGPYDVTFKGIPTTLKSLALAKKEGLPVELVRVSPTHITPEEENNELIDEHHVKLSQTELAELMRGCDVYLSNSHEAEGFGLPAMEALKCGLLSVLSAIPSYLSFSPRRDYCHFVPQFDDRATADAIKEIVTSSLDERRLLRNNSLEVAEEFSFEKACVRFAETLEQQALQAKAA